MTPPAPENPRAETLVDLGAIAANTAALRAHVGRPLMAVVKADGYGHGIVEAARAARAGGADWLGAAFVEEALAVRSAGDAGPVLSWVAAPGERYDAAIDADVDLGVWSTRQLDEVAAAARRRGRRAWVQLEADTGLSRGGATPDAWPALLDAAARAQAAGSIEVRGVWSHFACADEPAHPSVAAQLAGFREAVAQAEDRFDIAVRHLANSPATLAIPESWWDMARAGIAVYGVSPFADASSPVPLRPAMRLSARVALVKRVPAGSGVSYGHTHITARDTTLALVPLGYADGVPRHASGRGPVLIGGSRHVVAGRVCMDQFVVDVGDAPAREGDRAVLFGWGDDEPRVEDWARAAGTIGYEIVTRLGARAPRRHLPIERAEERA